MCQKNMANWFCIKTLSVLFFRIHQSTESGMIEKWKRKFYPHDRCTVEAATTARMPDPASIRDTQGAVIVLGIGLGGATLVLGAELLWGFYRRKLHSARNYSTNMGHSRNDLTLPTLSSPLHEVHFPSFTGPLSNVSRLNDISEEITEGRELSDIESTLRHQTLRLRSDSFKTEVTLRPFISRGRSVKVIRTMSEDAIDTSHVSSPIRKGTANGLTQTASKRNVHSNGHVNGFLPST